MARRKNACRPMMWGLVMGPLQPVVLRRAATRQSSQTSLDYSTFMEEARQGHIAKVKLDNNRTLKATSRDGKTYVVNTPGIQDPWMVGDLMKFGVQVEAQAVEEQSLLMSIFVSWFPMLLLIGVWIFFMRPMQGGGRGRALSFRESRARVFDENPKHGTLFAAVAAG